MGSVVFSPVVRPVERPETSYAAGRAVADRKGSGRKVSQVEQVLDVMRKAWDIGRRSLTNNEICDLLEVAYPAEHWHPGKVSARVADMIKADQLVRSQTSRLCASPRSSTREAHPVALRQRQASIAGA